MKKVLGYITMNAGDGIPGSILKWALSTYAPRFDYSVVVDGNLTEEAKKFYSTIPNLKVVDSPWTGRHGPQYYIRNSAIDDGDWLLALDDDEYPSEGLMELVHGIHTLPSSINIAYIPSLTYMSVDNTDNFWRVQTTPSREDYLRRSKRIFYKKSTKNNYFIQSPCGMHVTPTQIEIFDGEYHQSEKPVGDPRCFFYHMKTLESFIYNECVYNVSNPRHESGPQARQMTLEQETKFESLVNKYDLKNIPKFLEITKNHTWPKEFKDFVFQFKDKLGLAMCKFYYLYNYVSYGIKPENIEELMDCVSLGFNPIYQPVRKSSESPIVIPRTPSIWQ